MAVCVKTSLLAILLGIILAGCSSAPLPRRRSPICLISLLRPLFQFRSRNQPQHYGGCHAEFQCLG